MGPVIARMVAPRPRRNPCRLNTPGARVVVLWEPETAGKSARLGGHTASINRVAFGPEQAAGRALGLVGAVSSGSDLHDSGTCGPDAPGHSRRGYGACPPGRTATRLGRWRLPLSAGGVRILGPGHGPMLVLRGRTDLRPWHGLQPRAASGDGELGPDHRVWDTATGRASSSTPPGVMSVAFGPDGEATRLGSIDRTLKDWTNFFKRAQMVHERGRVPAQGPELPATGSPVEWRQPRRVSRPLAYPGFGLRIQRSGEVPSGEAMGADLVTGWCGVASSQPADYLQASVQRSWAGSIVQSTFTSIGNHEGVGTAWMAL